MTRLTDDLVRAALRDGAGTVDRDGLRPLAAPARSRRRWVIPACAAVTAAAAAVAAVFAVPHQRGEPEMSLASYVGARYVVDGAWPTGGKELTISEVSTDRIVGRVPAPAGSSGFIDAAGTGDNRTFLLTTADARACRTYFYRLTLRGNGTPEGLTALPSATVPGRQGDGPDQLAAAPGGGRLAYSTVGCGAGKPQGHITVVDVATGVRHEVGLPRGAQAEDLRWAPDGRRLTFRLAADGWDGWQMNLFDLATGARTPISLGPAGSSFEIGQITPDGGHLVAIVSTGGERRIVWYSLTSLAVTHQVSLGAGPANVPMIAGAGTDDVVFAIGDRFYRVRGTKVESKRVRNDGTTGIW
ncbi:TolB family protein [Actinomadura fibrosa]|uniref:TolB family protein n=1 Tax=Actinomadura fibrosa TaxID=111802 RepID=A0ABW2XGE4_9ACTN|nr:hypothetical protein [Actinomadura fibrosa]